MNWSELSFTERFAADDVPLFIKGAFTVTTPDEPAGPVAPVAPVAPVGPAGPCGPSDAVVIELVISSTTTLFSSG